MRETTPLASLSAGQQFPRRDTHNSQNLSGRDLHTRSVRRKADLESTPVGNFVVRRD
jgi:hypothetical protein